MAVLQLGGRQTETPDGRSCSRRKRWVLVLSEMVVVMREILLSLAVGNDFHNGGFR